MGLASLEKKTFFIQRVDDKLIFYRNECTKLLTVAVPGPMETHTAQNHTWHLLAKNTTLIVSCDDHKWVFEIPTKVEDTVLELHGAQDWTYSQLALYMCMWSILAFTLAVGLATYMYPPRMEQAHAKRETYARTTIWKRGTSQNFHQLLCSDPRLFSNQCYEWNSFGPLQFQYDGNIVVSDPSGNPIWASNTMGSTADNVIYDPARGLVMREGDMELYLIDPNSKESGHVKIEKEKQPFLTTTLCGEKCVESAKTEPKNAPEARTKRDFMQLDENQKVMPGDIVCGVTWTGHSFKDLVSGQEFTFKTPLNGAFHHQDGKIFIGNVNVETRHKVIGSYFFGKYALTDVRVTDKFAWLKTNRGSVIIE
jgi:hypothetical protein